MIPLETLPDAAAEPSRLADGQSAAASEQVRLQQIIALKASKFGC